MRVWLICAAWCLAAMAAMAQGRSGTPPGSSPQRPPPDGLQVFIDCRRGCDGSYIRSEVNFVDHVTDREVADVHVLITTRGTGGGGTEYAISYIGLRGFESVQDAAKFHATQDATDDEIRGGLVRTLKIGLLRYVALTALRDSMDVSFRPLRQQARQTAQSASDPWNSWVFRLRGNLSADGEKSTTSIRVSGAASASRVTEAWKTALNLNFNYRRNRYSFEDEGEDDYVSVSRDTAFGSSAVRSLGTHWGAGGRVSYSSSTYTNQARTWRVGPALEFNVFPYAETTRRQLTFRYSIALNDFTYREVTLYNKLDETLMSHALAVNLDLRQPWGTMDLQAQVSQYVPDTPKNRASIRGELDVRLFRGFSLNVGANTSLIRDQISLPAGEATPTEILLRQRQVATSYDYGLYMGFSYSFGSIYNNVVNTRLSGF